MKLSLQKQYVEENAMGNKGRHNIKKPKQNTVKEPAGKKPEEKKSSK
jgi:hypothetical protein